MQLNFERHFLCSFSSICFALPQCSGSCLILSGYGESQYEDDDDDLLPGPLARYRQLLFVVLKFCLALLASLGGDNKEAATQVSLKFDKESPSLTA